MVRFILSLGSRETNHATQSTAISDQYLVEEVFINIQTRSQKPIRKIANSSSALATVGFGLKVEKQEGMGLGLVADMEFKRGDLITQYFGTLITKQEANELGNRATHVISFGELCINGLADAQKAEGFGGGSFVNHSSKPNSQYVHKQDDCVYIEALRDIQKGEFITAKYSKKYLQLTELFQPI
jgi:hypothetical protein